MKNVIILMGQRVRSGSNFIASTLSKHPEIITLPPHKSFGEFNLFRDRAIEDLVLENISTHSFGNKLTPNDKFLFFKSYGLLWLDLFKFKYNIDLNKTVFIKTYVIDNLDLWSKTFPDAKIILLCRDGRDNVISSVKASNDRRNWRKPLNKIKRSIYYYSGYSFIRHLLHWQQTGVLFNSIKETPTIKKFKYEELIDSTSGISKLLDFCNLSYDSQILNECLNAPVVGSSFNTQNPNLEKTNWHPDSNKSNYQFTDKWRSWSFIKKYCFKRIAGKTLIALGYEHNNNW